MTKPVSLRRTTRGKRPALYSDPSVDEAMSMILALAQEVAVLRERFDTAERVCARRGLNLADEIEALTPDAEVLTAREAWRQGFYDRLFALARQRRFEMENQHTEDAYQSVLAEIAAKG